MLNDNVLNLLENHKSVRKFTNENISSEIKNKLEDAFCLAPTSRGLQANSLIEITKKEIKDKLAEISGQEYIKDVPLIYIFVTDYYRISKLANIQKFSKKQIVDGAIDSVIAAQSMFLVARENNLSGFYFGALHRDTKQVIELLKLPKFVVPVVGLCLGYSDENPNKKPRMDKNIRIFKDEYIIFDDYEKLLTDYDRIISEYIDIRFNEKYGKYTDNVKLSKFNDYNTEFEGF